MGTKVPFILNDGRRRQMAKEGFVVCMIVCDRKTHEVTVVKYRYDPERSEVDDCNPLLVGHA